MSKARDLGNLLDTDGDVVSSSLDNVPTPSKTSIEALGIELPAANLTGTVADTRFPATLPASSGVNLTALNASNISSGTLPSGRYTDTVYTHPTTAGNKHIPTAGATDQVLTYSSSGTAAWADPAASGLTNGSNVVSTTITDARDQTASHSWADITGGFQAIITPSATTSDILVMLNISSSNNNDHHFFRVVRDGSQITGGVGDAAGSRCRSFTEEYYTGVSGNMHRGSASWFVDTSVSTTSAVTYKVQLWGGSGVRINRGGNDSDNGGHARALSTLTLIELL